MNAVNRIILWLAFIFACLLPVSALTPTTPENSVWEIFSTGYDATTAEVTDAGNRTGTSTSNYDTSPIRGVANEEKPTEANRTLFGQSAEFKAAEGGSTAVRALTDAEKATYGRGKRGAVGKGDRHL